MSLGIKFLSIFVKTILSGFEKLRSKSVNPLNPPGCSEIIFGSLNMTYLSIKFIINVVSNGKIKFTIIVLKIDCFDSVAILSKTNKRVIDIPCINNIRITNELLILGLNRVFIYASILERTSARLSV